MERNPRGGHDVTGAFYSPPEIDDKAAIGRLTTPVNTGKGNRRTQGTEELILEGFMHWTWAAGERNLSLPGACTESFAFVLFRWSIPRNPLKETRPRGKFQSKDVDEESVELNKLQTFISAVCVWGGWATKRLASVRDMQIQRLIYVSRLNH